MRKRAVLYGRVSRDDSRAEGRNLEGQIAMGEEFANDRGYHIVARLCEDDKGASGADINLPKLSEIREMAQNSQFDVLIVREIDRLSRSLAKQLIVEQELKRHGVDIEYVLGDYPDTPEGNFMRHIRATVAEYEREKINERVIRGRYGKVKAGSVLVSGNAPYGYRLIQSDGRSELEVYEPEAEIVRRMFEWYISGLSTRKIARRLTDMGVPTFSDSRAKTVQFPRRSRSDGTWSWGTVRNMLQNETYSGTWYYGKVIGRGGWKKRQKEAQVAVSVPPIVSQEIWEAASAVRIRNQSERKHDSSYEYLLTGHIFCEHCGYRMLARTSRYKEKVYAYYRCNALRLELANECPYTNMGYHADVVDTVVWNWLTSLLTQPEQLRLGLEAYKAQKEENVAPLRERLQLVQEMLTEEESKLARLLDLYLSNDFPRDMLTDRRSRLEAKINALQIESLEIQGALEEQTISNEQMALIRRFGEEIALELESAVDDIELMRFVINLLELRVSLSDKDGVRTAFVQCALGKQLLPFMHTATSG